VARPRGFRSGRSRRSVNWSQGPSGKQQAQSGTGLLVWTLGLITTVGELTIVRTRGIVSVTLLSVSAAGDGFFGALGIGLVPSKSFVVGSTAIPGPLTESDWDGWLWHSFFDIRTVTATIADGANAAGVVQRISIDSKAMRKFQEDMTLIGVSEMEESGTATMEQSAECRVLVKQG